MTRLATSGSTPSDSRERAALVGLISAASRRFDPEHSLDELAGLAAAAGAAVVLRVMQERAKPDPATFLGSGKLEQLAGRVSWHFLGDDLVEHRWIGVDRGWRRHLILRWQLERLDLSAQLIEPIRSFRGLGCLRFDRSSSVRGGSDRHWFGRGICIRERRPGVFVRVLYHGVKRLDTIEVGEQTIEVLIALEGWRGVGKCAIEVVPAACEIDLRAKDVVSSLAFNDLRGLVCIKINQA